MTSLGENSRHSPSAKVVPSHPVSRKNRLRVDPPDKEGLRTSKEAKSELASSSAAEETSKLQLLLR